MISFRNLSKQYGNLRAVDSISFEVSPGELFGLLGPNGAGKTTTISMISGLLRPDQGTVLIGDLDFWRDPRKAVPTAPAIRTPKHLALPGSRKPEKNGSGNSRGV